MHPMDPALQARIRIVQSPANHWVKSLRAAIARPPSPAQTDDGSSHPPPIAIEGFHLLVEAMRSGLTPTAVFLRGGQEAATLDALQAKLDPLNSSAFPAATRILAVPDPLFGDLVATEAPHGIAALLPAPRAHTQAVLDSPAPLVLVLAALQDPGNVGTLLRSAQAFGAACALLLAGTATPWSGKCMRASAGAVFHLPLLFARSAEDAAALLKEHRIPSFAAVARGGEPAHAAPLREAAAIWIGNEGSGLSPRAAAACDARITVPMPGDADSLNAAVAGSLLLYEAARQRSGYTARLSSGERL